MLLSDLPAFADSLAEDGWNPWAIIAAVDAHARRPLIEARLFADGMTPAEAEETAPAVTRATWALGVGLRAIGQGAAR